jgi:hypothetical protein
MYSGGSKECKIMSPFTFPVGYHDFHKTKIIDFQLNRWHSLGYARLKDMEEAAANINAQSITERIFSREDHGQNHCQIGNLGLALEVMAKWLLQE